MGKETAAEKRRRLARRADRKAKATAAGFDTIAEWQAAEAVKAAGAAPSGTPATTPTTTKVVRSSGKKVTTSTTLPVKPNGATTPGVDAVLSSGPTGGTAPTTGVLNPIGVPTGYTVPGTAIAPTEAHRGRGWTAAQIIPADPGSAGTGPQYGEGDDLKLLGDLVGTDGLIDLQARMKAAGFIPSKTKVQAGAIDGATQSGVTLLMGVANATGKSWEQTLEDLVGQKTDEAALQALAGDGGGGGGGGGSSVTLPDPERVRQAIDQAGQQTIGRNVPQAEREAIVAEINNDYTAASAAGVASYDLDANIRRKIKEKFGGEASGNDLLGALNTFVGMLGVGGGFGTSPTFGGSNVGPATGAIPVQGAPAGSY